MFSKIVPKGRPGSKLEPVGREEVAGEYATYGHRLVYAEVSEVPNGAMVVLGHDSGLLVLLAHVVGL